MDDISALVEGFNTFKRRWLAERTTAADDETAAAPHILMIACCDSRVDPAIITDSRAGDIMVVRNLANLVPPYREDGPFQELQAAVEVAVCYHQVEHIIVMGHSRCAAIRSLLTRLADDLEPSQALDRWTAIAETAGRTAIESLPQASLDDKACAASRLALRQSLDNLAEYPWVQWALQRDSVRLHAWYFNLGQAGLESYEHSSDCFRELTTTFDQMTGPAGNRDHGRVGVSSELSGPVRRLGS